MEMQLNNSLKAREESFVTSNRCLNPSPENDWSQIQCLFYAGDSHIFERIFKELFHYTCGVLVWQIISSRKGYDLTRKEGIGNLQLTCLFLAIIIWSDKKGFLSKEAFFHAYSELLHRCYKHTFDAIRRQGSPFTSGLYAAAFDALPGSLKEVINTLINEI